MPGNIKIINFRMSEKPKINADIIPGSPPPDDQKKVVFKITISKATIVNAAASTGTLQLKELRNKNRPCKIMAFVLK